MSPNFNGSLEAYFKELPEAFKDTLSLMTHRYPPFTPVRQPIEGARLVISQGETRCRRIETTIGDFDISSEDDILNLLKKGVRFLFKGQTSGDIVTLQKWFPDYICYYNALSGGAREVPPIPHPVTITMNSTLLQWTPCSCPHKDCPYLRPKLSGWVEDIREIYNDIGEVEKDPPPSKIKEIFTSIEKLFWEKESLSVKYFSHPGQVAGNLLLAHTATLINPQIPYGDRQRDLWNEALIMARVSSPLGLGWASEVTVTKAAIHEDVKSSHFSNLANLPLLTPALIRLEGVGGYGSSEASYWEKVKECVAAISLGKQAPPRYLPPRQHRFPSKKGRGWGVVPTHYPVIDTIDRENILSLGRDMYTPIRTIFFFKKYEGPTKTYKPLVKKWYRYTLEASPFGRYVKKLSKVLTGKQYFHWSKNHSTEPLGFSNPYWGPLNPLPIGYEGPLWIEEHIGPSGNALIYFFVLCREEAMLRLQLALREKKGRVLHSLKDSDTYIGPKGQASSTIGLGAFRPKTRIGQEIAILSDLKHTYKGDRHSVDWLECAKNANPRETIVKAPKITYRQGLEIFKELPLPQAYKDLGNLKNLEPTCPLGSNKLLGPKVTVEDLFKPEGKKFTLAETPREIEEVLSKQGGLLNE